MFIYIFLFIIIIYLINAREHNRKVNFVNEFNNN